MALSPTYLETLTTQLTNAANSKKNAIDLRLQTYSTAKFDETGKLVGYGDTGLGTRDVAQQEGERMLAGRAEGAGMLRSGQYARDLATSQAAYRADIMGQRGQAASEKSTIEYGLAKDLAEAQAAYDTSTPKDQGTGGGGTGGTGTQTQDTDDNIPAPPAYTPTGRAPAAQRTPARVTSNLPAGFTPARAQPYTPASRTNQMTSAAPAGFRPPSQTRVTSPTPSRPATPATPPKPVPTTPKRPVVPARGGTTKAR